MINTIPIKIRERGDIDKDVSILAMENENKSKTLVITLPVALADKWIYIDFEQPFGTKTQTERLLPARRGGDCYVEYTLTNALLNDVGTLKMQVIAKDGDDLVWKSYKTSFTIKDSINASESIAEAKRDVLSDLQRQIDEIDAGGDVDLSGYYTAEEVDAKISAVGGEATPVVAVSGAEHTIIPNKHYVISGVTNSLTITLDGNSDTEIKKYSFEFTTYDRIPTLTVNGASLPFNTVLEKFRTYVCEVVNKKVLFVGEYDGYPYQYVYGLYASADWSSSYTFNNDRTFSEYLNETTNKGTYQVDESDNSQIYLSFDGGDFKMATLADKELTVNGVIYTKQ